MQIANNTFIVTGGASGLGRATAELLLARGGKVLIGDVAPDGAAVAKQLGCLWCETDVTNEVSAQGAILRAQEVLGGLHGLINCAGIIMTRKVLASEGIHPLDNFARCVNINLIGTFNMIRLAAEAMREAKPNAGGERGVIVNTASIVAYDGQIGQAGYSASKAGVVGMTLPIARELARYGIRVMTICPGLFETPMLMGLPEAPRQAAAASIPFPSRFGRPAEYAALVEHIIENEMLNGEVIRIDGAVRMQP